MLISSRFSGDFKRQTAPLRAGVLHKLGRYWLCATKPHRNFKQELQAFDFIEYFSINQKKPEDTSRNSSIQTGIPGQVLHKVIHRKQWCLGHASRSTVVVHALRP
jgi:hypothetical protein